MALMDTSIGADRDSALKLPGVAMRRAALSLPRSLQQCPIHAQRRTLDRRHRVISAQAKTKGVPLCGLGRARVCEGSSPNNRR